MKPAIFGGNTPPVPPGLSITVYEADTTTLAAIYDFETEGIIDQAATPLVADADGRFSFLVDPGQLIDIQLGGEGTTADLNFNGGGARWYRRQSMTDASTLRKLTLAAL